MRNSTNCTRPVSFGKLKKSTWSRMPTTIAPTTAVGNDVMPPIERGGEPEQQRLGADRTRGRSSPAAVAYEDRPTIAERKPAMVQIAVDIIFGLMPVRRARSALVADGAHRLAEARCGRAATTARA